MVTIRYETGEGEPAEIEPLDNEFEYVPEGGFWAVVVDSDDDDEIVKWIPGSRLYEIQGKRSRIREKRP